MGTLTGVLQGILAAVFLIAGAGKVSGAKMHKDNFKKWRLPQRFRVVTGSIELLAAVLLILGFWLADLVLIGALMIVAIGIGGVMTHMRVKDSSEKVMPIGVLGLLGLILAIIAL